MQDVGGSEVQSHFYLHSQLKGCLGYMRKSRKKEGKEGRGRKKEGKKGRKERGTEKERYKGEPLNSRLLTV